MSQQDQPDVPQEQAQEEEEQAQIVVLADAEGNEREFEIIQVIQMDDGRNYAVLFPVGSGDDTEEGVILRVDNVDGEETLVEIEDEAELQAVADAWNEFLASSGSEEPGEAQPQE